MAEKNYEKLYVECVALGEDGRMENLAIDKFMYQGERVNCTNGKAGPIRVYQSIPAEFMITFEKKTKMGLNLILSEGGNRWVIL